MTALALTAMIVLPGTTVPQPTEWLPPRHDTPTHTTTTAPKAARTTPGAPQRQAPAWDGTVQFWEPYVAVYFHPADRQWALDIIACESGGNPNAKNPHSSASGLFQFLRGTWDWAAPEVGADSYASGAVYEPTANIRAAAWLLYEGGGKSHWVCKA